LVFVGPDRLLLAAAVGCAVEVVWSHLPPVKTVFNIAVPLLEAIVAVVSFHAVLGPADAISLRGSLAGFVAVTAANLVSAVSVQAVIALSLRRFDRAVLATVAFVQGGVTVLNVAVGIVAVVLLWVSPLAVLPFLGIAAVLGFGYRSHSKLRRRYDDLQEMYGFSQALAGLSDAGEVIRAVLLEAKTRLRGGLAELALEEADGTVCYTLRGDGPVLRTIGPGSHPLRSEASEGVVARKTTNNKTLVRALTACGFRDAVAAALPAVYNVAGTLIVADRLSDQLSFEPADLELLKGLAIHTSTALHAAQLLDWLREEVAAKNHLALHDPLTDLANRALFNQQVETSLALQSETLVAVMLMDLDRFKQVNDTFGHRSGDAILRKIAAQLTRAVGDKGSVGRLGGDEFAVVTALDSRSELTVVARDVFNAGHAAISVDGQRLDVSASLGVAVAPDHGHDRSTLLAAADAAMYHAKANGGGVAFHEPSSERLAGPPLVSASEQRPTYDDS
jgi:diguanylate cyclase (GGDEF)-like protein